MDKQNSTIIIDNGSGFLKAGFSSDPAPSAVFPSIIGRPKLEGEMTIYIGEQAY